MKITWAVPVNLYILMYLGFYNDMCVYTYIYNTLKSDRKALVNRNLHKNQFTYESENDKKNTKNR
jgi:hypothetical protein